MPLEFSDPGDGLRIIFLLTQSLESPSGLGRYWPLSRELARLGNRVVVLALHPNWDGLKEYRFEQDGVYVEYVGQMHVRKPGNTKSYFSSTRLVWIAAVGAWRLVQVALRVPADVIHIAKPHPMNGIAGLAVRWLRGSRLYLDCDDYEAESNYFGGAWQRQGVAFFEDRLPARMMGVTTNTRFMEKRLRALGVASQRIVHVPNGVDRVRFAGSPPERVEALRARLGLVGHPVVLYLGSLSPTSHPVGLLIEAFARLSQEIPKARLLLVGGGEGYESLQQKAQAAGIGERTIFAGRVTPEQVVDYYRLATVSVDPVYDDFVARARSPLKLFESWAAGTPFVTADVGDRRELLGNSVAGLLAEPGNAASLAVVIRKVLQNPNLANSLKHKGWKRVKSFYWDKLVRDFVRVYEDAQV